MAEGAPIGLTPEGSRQSAPIIVTALMGAADFAWADQMRRTHFPPERNQLSAHITLFHHLPPAMESELLARLAHLSTQPPPPALLADVMHLERGVAYRIDSPSLLAMRSELADMFHGLLTPQDSARPRLHLTVQNKVSPEESRALYEQLRAGFRPRPFTIRGLGAFRYRGGPWEEIRSYSFRG